MSVNMYQILCRRNLNIRNIHQSLLSKCEKFINGNNLIQFTNTPSRTSPDGKTHNQIDHGLIGRRWHEHGVEENIWT